MTAGRVSVVWFLIRSSILYCSGVSLREREILDTTHRELLVSLLIEKGFENLFAQTLHLVQIGGARPRDWYESVGISARFQQRADAEIPPSLTLND